MKLAISHIHVAVHGSVASVVLAPGVQVDLDQVVGHQAGRPLRLADALGAHVDGFTPVDPPQTNDRRSRRSLSTSTPSHSPAGDSDKE